MNISEQMEKNIEALKKHAEEWKKLKPESWVTRSTTPRERIDPSTICDICFESEGNCDD